MALISAVQPTRVMRDMEAVILSRVLKPRARLKKRVIKHIPFSKRSYPAQLKGLNRPFPFRFLLPPSEEVSL